MEYAVNANGFAEGRLQLSPPTMTKAAVLTQDGQPAPRVEGKKNVYRLRRDDGNEVEAQLKPGLLDPIPQIVLEGQTLRVAPPLPWYLTVLCALPLVLLVGGAIGGGLGAGTFYLNLGTVRAQQGVLRFVLPLVFTGIAMVVYVVLAVAIQSMVH